ncbi:hypothetical protein [Methylosinus sp. PW1]|uniref:hypothetical protein n=1 Tax=Methylosinus sp. PW1 TaxID=107636 RepID=UPI000562E9D4|nr:hypothetical protein [Methylosinus sp. PW1]
MLGLAATCAALALEPTVSCPAPAIGDGAGCHDKVIETMRGNAGADSNILQLLVSWQACFTKEDVTDRNVQAIIEACDRAATSSSLSRKERERITYRRAKILQAASKAQAPAAGKVGPEAQ